MRLRFQSDDAVVAGPAEDAGGFEGSEDIALLSIVQAQRRLPEAAGQHLGGEPWLNSEA